MAALAEAQLEAHSARAVRVARHDGAARVVQRAGVRRVREPVRGPPPGAGGALERGRHLEPHHQHRAPHWRQHEQLRVVACVSRAGRVVVLHCVPPRRLPARALCRVDIGGVPAVMGHLALERAAATASAYGSGRESDGLGPRVFPLWGALAPRHHGHSAPPS